MVDCFYMKMKRGSLFYKPIDGMNGEALAYYEDPHCVRQKKNHKISQANEAKNQKFTRLVNTYPLFGWVFDIIFRDLFISLIISSAIGSPNSVMDLTAQIESSISSVCNVTSRVFSATFP
jgi:hypothetical protein